MSSNAAAPRPSAARSSTGASSAVQDDLRFPFDEAPPTATVLEVAPGILWTRIPLPFKLNHVNIFLIEDGDGWAVLDTGIGDQRTKDVWEALAAGPLAGRRITRLIVSHFHPDHIGLAGWMCERFGVPLITTMTSYLGCINISLTPDALGSVHFRDFYRSHGMPEETANAVATHGHGYLRMVTPLPPTFERVVAGDRLRIGGRIFEVMTGDGHAPDQIMLYQPDANLFLGADQVLAKITPNISVWAVDPDGDPLGLYMRSLAAIQARIPEDAFVLPGHQLPFFGLHDRCRQLVQHHETRCDMIAAACRNEAKSVAELVPVIFHRPLDPHQLSFAFSEVHAHVNLMVRRGELVWTDADASRRRVTAV